MSVARASSKATRQIVARKLALGTVVLCLTAALFTARPVAAQTVSINVSFGNSPGSGTLSANHGSPSSCTSDCTITVDTSGGSVAEVLTATPDNGSQFLYWVSASSTGPLPCGTPNANQCSFTASTGAIDAMVTFILSGGPGITSLSPTGYQSLPFTLIVNGINFTPSSVVLFKGIAHNTTYVSPTQLWADIGTDGMGNSTGTADANGGDVQVKNGTMLSNIIYLPVIGGGGGSPQSIQSLSPNTAVAGSPNFTLNVTLNAVPSPSATVFWTISARTSVVNGSQVSATITAADIAQPGFYRVSIRDNGLLTGATLFQVTAPPTNNPTPSVLTTAPGTMATNTANNPTSISDPLQGCGSTSKSKPAWFEYVAKTNGTITANTSGSSYTTLMSAFTGSANGAFLGCSAGSVISAIGPGSNTTQVPATLSFSATAGTAYWFFVTAANGDGGALNFNLNFTASSPASGLARTSGLPQVVRGGGYVTKMTIVNMAKATNNVVVNFVGTDGTVAQTQTLQMAAAQTVRIATPESERNNGAILQWATVGSDLPISANLFFELAQPTAINVTNAVGFNDSPPVSSFVFPVEFETAVGRTTGLAVSNPSAGPATVTLNLVNSGGAIVATATVPLAAYAKASYDLASDGRPEIAPIKAAIAALSGANFIGTLSGTSTAAVNILAVGDDEGPFFSTPPLGAGGTRLVIPQIVAGTGGYVTKLTFVNLTGAANHVTLTYYDGSGNVVAVPGLPATVDLAANGAKRFFTSADRFSGPAQIAWAVATSSGALGANLFFEVMDKPNGSIVNTIGFNTVPELTSFSFPAEFQPQPAGAVAGRTMALALANAGASTANVTLTLLDASGAPIATSQLALAALNQAHIDLSTITAFRNALPNGNFIGAIAVTSDVPVVGLALEDDLGPFSAVPPVSGTPN